MEMLKWGAEGTPNELMPRAASRRRCDQLVARLGTFTHPFQMPGNQWLKRLSIIHRRRRRSSPDRSSMRESRRAPSSAALTNCRELGLQGRVGEGVSTFVAQSLVQIVAFRPLGVGALTSLNKGFGDLEIRWSGFRREKPTPVVHERWAAFWSHPLRSVKPIERPFMAQSGRRQAD